MVLCGFNICEVMKAVAYISFQVCFGTDRNFNSSLWLFFRGTKREKNCRVGGKGLIPPPLRSVANRLLKETVDTTDLPSDLCEFGVKSMRMGGGP